MRAAPLLESHYRFAGEVKGPQWQRQGVEPHQSLPGELGSFTVTCINCAFVFLNGLIIIGVIIIIIIIY